MLRVWRNKQRGNWVREKRPTFHLPIGRSERLEEMPHMLRHTRSLTQAQKLKVNIAHVGVAELLFISRLTDVCVCAGLVANNVHTEFHPC